MAPESKTVHVEAGSELARLVLIKDGVRYRVQRDDPVDSWADYDPARFRQVLAEVAGTWSDIDADELIADIYRWREEGSRSAGWPRS